MRKCALLLLLFSIGCSSSTNQPDFGKLYPVSGTVMLNGNTVNGGVIQLKPDPDKPEFLINSEVSSDGKFSMSTVRTTDSSGARETGVAPGTYKVTYIPNLLDQTAGYKEPVVLSKPVVVEAKDNNFVIELPATRR